MIFRQVNMNGTDAADLALAYLDASNLLEQAIRAMYAPFHGRDYQLVPGSFEEARREMNGRELAIRAVKDEIDAIIGKVAESIKVK